MFQAECLWIFLLCSSLWGFEDWINTFTPETTYGSISLQRLGQKTHILPIKGYTDGNLIKSVGKYSSHIIVLLIGVHSALLVCNDT